MEGTIHFQVKKATTTNNKKKKECRVMESVFGPGQKQKRQKGGSRQLLAFHEST
jgi:hypothetical protein